MPRFAEKLHQLGYRFIRFAEGYSEAFSIRFKARVSYTKPISGDLSMPLILDVHCDLFTKGYGIQVETHRLWKTARNIRIQGMDTLVLSLENFLLHLCLHLHAHFHARLVGYSDLLTVFDKEIDWSHLVNIAKEYGVRSPIHYVLSQAKEMLDVPIPPDVLAQLKPISRIAKLFAAVPRAKWALLGYHREKDVLSFLLNLLVLDLAITRKLQLLLRVLFPSLEWLSYRYSVSVKRTICFYYYLQWYIELASRSVRAIISLPHIVCMGLRFLH